MVLMAKLTKYVPVSRAQEPVAKGAGLSVRTSRSGSNSINITGGMAGSNGTCFWLFR